LGVLAFILAHFHPSPSGMFEWGVAQGIEMRRPSHLQARVEKIDGKVVSSWVGGGCVMVSEGHIFVD